MKRDVILMLDKKEHHQVKLVTVDEKEALMNQGEHYSTMVVKENVPHDWQQDLFMQYWHDAENKQKIANGVYSLAEHILNQETQKVVLVSLIRAGLPLGMMLKRTIELLDNEFEVHHYGVSIIKDKDIPLDKAAMEAIFAIHGNCKIYFVDGWIGKGAISSDLEKSCQKLNIKYELLTLMDVTGEYSSFSPYANDFIIPFGLLNSTISCLMSRSLYQPYPQMHGYVEFSYLRPYNLSNQYVDDMMVYIKNQLESYNLHYVYETPTINSTQLRTKMIELVNNYHLSGIDKVKPSICEATRAILRRKPKKVLFSQTDTENLSPIINHCVIHKIPMKVIPDSFIKPYKMISLLE